MYQINAHSDAWPDLDEALDDFLDQLTTRLKLEKNNLITIVLGDDALVQPLNATYRGKDASTNVLSFKADTEDELGDLVFALEVVEREAREQDKPFLDHFKHLILHGSLHLLGYDHEIEAEAVEMEALEVKILSEFGLPDPYAP